MYTIKEVSKMMDVSEHTLRFWAKSDFFPLVQRNENNFRMFSDTDVEFVKIIKCLRAIGTDNKNIKKYIDLCLIGDSTIEQRYEIIKETHKKAIAQMEEHKKRLELLEYKEQYYQNLMKKAKSN